ncbi:MAG: RNase adapter RapZ [Pseudomonadota bacterium]|nr:RNase adapter RapZ [Pseudomonadota bacterium]
MKLLIISGISGSGKTTFIRALEDAGYFCVDHIPLVLLQRFGELSRLVGNKIDKCALVVDIREKEFFDIGKNILKRIKERFGAELIFLESSDEALIRRFKETRRLHPLFDEPNVKDAIIKERELVGWIKEISDRIIDTTNFTIHELRRFVLNTYSHDEQKMKINLISFGYSYGIPLEADIALDVRFLPNPYFHEGLKYKTGLSKEVAEYITSDDVFNKYFLLLLDFLLYLIPLYEKEGKSYLTICFGCTGGKHRSVFVVSRLAEQFSMMGYNVNTIHRDIEK